MPSLVAALWLLATGCGDGAAKPAAAAATAAQQDGAPTSGDSQDGAATPGAAGAGDTVATGDTAASGDSASAADTVPEVTLPDSGGCLPQCQRKLCGPDGCGAVCGFCKSGEVCASDGSQCKPFCAKQCANKVCGPDGCGGQCGSCDSGQSCGVDGKCYQDSCAGSCSGKNCGDDGCGKSCGECAGGDYCDGSQCKASACKGLDPNKGQCQGDVLLTCSGSGATAVKNAQDCAATPGKTCGWDPAKSAYACIQKTCDASCVTADGKKMVCGQNGCGQPCGSCADGWKCNVTSCDPLPGASCTATSFPPAGQCSGDVWIYCNTGKLAYVDCVKDAGMNGCGWNAATKKFECQ